MTELKEVSAKGCEVAWRDRHDRTLHEDRDPLAVACATVVHVEGSTFDVCAAHRHLLLSDPEAQKLWTLKDW